MDKEGLDPAAVLPAALQRCPLLPVTVQMVSPTMAFLSLGVVNECAVRTHSYGKF